MNDYQMVEYLQKFGLSSGTTLGHHSGAMDLIADRFVELLNKIDRQQAKIEVLTMDNNQLQSDIVNANCNYEEIKEDCKMLKQALAQKVVSKIKSETLEEFKDKFCKNVLENHYMLTNNKCGGKGYGLFTMDIDTMVKAIISEMVGEK